MLVRNSRKHQPEFDLEEAVHIYTRAGLDKVIRGEAITSPYELFCVETLRDRFSLRKGREVCSSSYRVRPLRRAATLHPPLNLRCLRYLLFKPSVRALFAPGRISLDSPSASLTS